MQEQIIDFIKDQIANNDFASGALFAGALTAIWATVRGWPSMLWYRIYRYISYSVTVEQSDELYMYLTKYLSEKYPKELRNVEAVTRMTYGNYDHTNFGKVIYRHHSDFIYVWMKWRLIRIEKEREKLENAEGFSQAYMGRVRITGFFAKGVIRELIRNAYALKPNEAEVKTKRIWQHHGWSKVEVLTSKSIDHIYYPKKQELLDVVDHFKTRQDYYEGRGIEWYLGICLYGPPGTAKSTLAKALAYYTGRRLYTLSLASISDSTFEGAFADMGPNALLVLDDIDIGLQNREATNDTGVKLSTLLSHLDGSMSRGDLIVVMTTNDISKLDPALTRPGRVDLKQEVSYPNADNISEYIRNFFDEDVVFLGEPRVMVDVQRVCLQSTSAAEALEKLNT